MFVQASVFCDKKIEKALAYYGISSKLQVQGQIAGGGGLVTFCHFLSLAFANVNYICQGILTEGKGSVQLTSLH